MVAGSEVSFTLVYPKRGQLHIQAHTQPLRLRGKTGEHVGFAAMQFLKEDSRRRANLNASTQLFLWSDKCVMMTWNELLDETRRKPKTDDDGNYKLAGQLDDRRNQFERDYDRVIFTSSFRRLQDKAQVFPLETSDFVRTRLTHSIEVSTIGRSLAIDVGRRLQELNVDGAPDSGKIAAIVATTCLLHDVGNPPFGHFGESAIQEWFVKEYKVSEIPCLTREQKADFANFEGNAQALRIATRLQMHNNPYGLNLTFATLGSLIKYPCSSLKFDSNSTNKARTKPGYFQSERSIFDDIARVTGTGGSRHPLVYLMEAADDIAYSVIDIEDAVRKGVLHFRDVLDFLTPRLLNSGNQLLIDLLHDINTFIAKHPTLPEQYQVYMLQLRILAHGVMIKACSDTFINRYDDIMDGKYELALLEDSDVSSLYHAFKDLAKDQVYTQKAVLTLEYLGKEVIDGLLCRFIPAALAEDERKKTRTTSGKLYHLISPTFQYIEEIASKESLVYNRLQLVTDFICGMTDTYALDLYQRLTGVKIK